ncbi:UDP-glucose-glycoprotein glucosyltransferase isoform X2 [Lycorma delicatula]|uniref:UDP-glucose-glycoprotein glucosyltransferase isoform X2 n=1 Tax=Lycorma delicatula TaxID=130591 RepID=UPI003F50FC53
MWWGLVFMFLLWNAGVGAKKKSKSVTTVIDTKWEVTPAVLEVAEYLAEEDSHLFWLFIDKISALDPPIIDLGTEKAMYDKVIHEAGALLTPAQISVLKLALSLRVYSPRIEMYNQMASQRGVSCPIAVDIANQLICVSQKVESAIDKALADKDVKRLETFRLDHHFPGADNRSVVAILYGELGTPEFAQFHKILKQRSNKGEIDYVVRHFVKERPNRKVRLSGYGVELQMKSTEYKVQDDTKVSDLDKSGADNQTDDDDEEVGGFNFNQLKKLYPDKKESLDKLRQELLDTSSEMAPLKVWQFQELSLQAAQRIISAPEEEALSALTNIAQNFPMQARSLVRTVVNNELKHEMKQNQERFANSLNIQPSDTALFINGMFFEVDNIDMMTILDIIRQELRILEGLHKIGITEKKILSKLLALDLSSSTGHEYAIDIRDSAVQWVNDIETDKQFRRWSVSLLDLLRPTFPGMLRSIRRNLYNLVIIGDPSSRKVWPLIKLAESFHIHAAPLRIGLVFAVNSTATGMNNGGVALLNAFNYIAETKDPFSALSFVTDVYASIKDEDKDVLPGNVYKLLTIRYPNSEPDEVLGPDTDYDTGRRLASDFVQRSGFHHLPQVLLNGVPLAESTLNADDFEDAVFSEVMSQTPTLQKAVYKGDLTDSMNVVDYLMDQPNVMPRLNDRILNIEKSRFIDLVSSAKPCPITETLLNDIKYASLNKKHDISPTSDEIHLLSNWVITDVNTQNGRELLNNALEQMRSSGKIRISVILNSEANNDEVGKLERLIVGALKSLTPDQATNRIKRILVEYEDIISGKKDHNSYDIVNVEWDTVDETLKNHKLFLNKVIKFSPGQRGIISNGRLLGPFNDNEHFTIDDFGLLERFSYSAHVDKIFNILVDKSDEEQSFHSDVLMKAVSLLVARPQTKSRFEIPSFGEEHSVVKLAAKSQTQPAFDITAIVDPVSRGAQKIGPILNVLKQVINCDIRIFLNCVEKNSDMPLKSFYRYVVEPELQFTSDGHATSGPVAKFSNMPAAPLLTQNMHVPENWLVESVATPYDLDNIRLEEVESVVHSQFELEYLLLEGHCFEATMGNPPRGLQITLGTESQPVVVDTIVMANLGYFQLKANPGSWILRLRQGRSAEIFDITSHEGSDTPENSTDIKVLISSFKSNVLKLRVTKKPDKIGVDLLGDDDDAQSGLWNSITSTFSGSSKDEVDEVETINIFSLASGHLYERFLRIMMLSVLKNTKSPVKFWFLKNYLSPTFKDFLPRMAKEYKFQYELVQYKWPRWLHQQTEKQRIIWGYKILFLDVLFPLDVKKIIFVDADQVVRADMKELVDLDLGGAPYGYTPFCESRTEMDGFRFWKQGYWRNHLQGRRYHISALYVVDLRRFRRIAAGDRLRGQYQALSQDPNSLSNLDQDLPNNMIHQVAIKSLPQEWLWCETWCDDESKKYAKTIDLCNNPLTKEAKLTAAMRIVEEWKDYDAEIKALQLKLGATDEHEEEEHHPTPSVSSQIVVPTTEDVHSEL